MKSFSLSLVYIEYRLTCCFEIDVEEERGGRRSVKLKGHETTVDCIEESAASCMFGQLQTLSTKQKDKPTHQFSLFLYIF